MNQHQIRTSTKSKKSTKPNASDRDARRAGQGAPKVHPSRAITGPRESEPDTLRAQWLETREEREAIAESALRPVNFDFGAGMLVVRAAARRVMPLRARIVEELPRFDLRRLDRLDAYCGAAIYANSRAQNERTAASPKVTYEAAATLVAKLARASAPLADAGLLSPEALAQIQDAPGWRNRMADLHALASLLGDAWSEIEGRTTVTRQDLQAARSLAEQLEAYLSTRGVAPAVSPCAIDRLRATTLVLDAYDHVRRAVGWLRWFEGDASELAPSVYVNPFARTRRSVSTKGDEEPDGPSDGENKPAPTPKGPVPPAEGTATGGNTEKSAREADERRAPSTQRPQGLVSGEAGAKA